MVKIGNATERCNLHDRLVNSAVKAIPVVLMKKKNIAAAESKKKTTAFLGLKKNDDQRRVRGSMKLSVKEISHSEAIHVRESLLHHKSPKIRREVQVVFDSWRNTLHSGGRRDDSKTTCNKPLPILMMKKKNTAAVIKKSDKLIRPTLQMKKESIPKKNTAEMLELFEIAKKSADIANAKGILWAKEETCLCLETLSLTHQLPYLVNCQRNTHVHGEATSSYSTQGSKDLQFASSLHQHWT